DLPAGRDAEQHRRQALPDGRGGGVVQRPFGPGGSEIDPGRDVAVRVSVLAHQAIFAADLHTVVRFDLGERAGVRLIVRSGGAAAGPTESGQSGDRDLREGDAGGVILCLDLIDQGTGETEADQVPTLI